MLSETCRNVRQRLNCLKLSHLQGEMTQLGMLYDILTLFVFIYP